MYKYIKFNALSEIAQFSRVFLDRGAHEKRAYCAHLCLIYTEIENGDPGRTRTPNPLIRSQVLYPVELRDRCEMLIPILRQMIKAKYHQTHLDAGLAKMP